MIKRSTTDARPALNKERVLETAVELADQGGLEALSMRKLADELGVAAMSLYYYFPGKDELITGMVDLVFAEIELPTGEVDWKDAMQQRALSTRETLKRHRWAVGYMESRETPGPASIRAHDTILGYLREAGFSLELTVQAYSVLDAYIYGFALQDKSLPFEDAEGAAALAREQAPQFEAQAKELAEEYPHLAEVVADHVAKVGYDAGQAFQYGLDLILDALEQRLHQA